jgi:hypothetical protein
VKWGEKGSLQFAPFDSDFVSHSQSLSHDVAVAEELISGGQMDGPASNVQLAR